MPPTVALVDCAAFYVSCERAFRPDLEGRPVVVLSNNDGCIVARSDEAKALGVPMAAPYFKWRSVLEVGRAYVFSSNYALYADMSRRVMDVLAGFAADVEVYSIDEAFLALPATDPAALVDLAARIHARVHQWTGIPVRVGMGPTKTLAKVAAARAKQAGAFAYALPPDPADDLAAVPVEDVWGIGRAFAQRFRETPTARGTFVRTALDLARADDAWLRRGMKFSVAHLRTVHELRGEPCLPLDAAPAARHSLVRSRSFSEPIGNLEGVQRAVATYASRAAEKARRLGLAPAVFGVFLTTGGHGAGPHHAGTLTARLDRRTAFTPSLLAAAHALTARLFRPGCRYRKAGVTLLELGPATPAQGHLFLPEDPREGALMAALDRVNGRYGPGTLHYAAAAGSMKHAHEPWQMQRAHTSPAYTTAWGGLRTV